MQLPHFTSAALLFVGFSVLSLYSQPGSLMTDFGEGGSVVIDVEGRVDRFVDVTTGQNGDIFAVGYSELDDESQYVIAKFDRYGTPVVTFGDAGIIRDNFENGSFSEAVSISLDAQENLFVAFNKYGQDSLTLNYQNQIIVAKYNKEGALDTSFANKGYYSFHHDAKNWAANVIHIHTTGGIYVAAESGSLITLFKLGANGDLDTTFADKGIMVSDHQNKFQRILAMTEQTNGALILAGEANVINNDWRAFLTRISSEGHPDSTFAETGYIMDTSENNSRANGLAVQQDGKILFSGSKYNGTINDAFFRRYLTDGQLDPTFGNAGTVLLPTGGNNVMNSIYSLSNDLIVAAGDYALVRLTLDGSPDPLFGMGGIVNVRPFYIYKMILDDQEDMIIAGGTFQAMLLAKYRSHVSTASSMHSNHILEVSLYPNPTSGNLTLDYKLTSPEILRASLISFDGRIIQTIFSARLTDVGIMSELIQLNSALPPGFYILRFQVGPQVQQLKVVVQ